MAENKPVPQYNVAPSQPQAMVSDTFMNALTSSYANEQVSPEIANIRSSYTAQDPVKAAQQRLAESNKEWNNVEDTTYSLGRPTEAVHDKASLSAKNYNVDELYSQLSTGEYVKNFDTYTPGIDNMEHFAQAQTNWDKWTNGATKALSQFGTGVIGGTVGTVYGIGAAIKEGSLSATYDNNFAHYLDNFNEKLKFELPNYRTKDEKKASYLENLGTANFWADDFLGGLSFTASAIATELIWAELGGNWANRGARIGAGLSKAGRVVEEGTHALSYVDDATRVASRAKTATVKPLADMTRNTLMNTRKAIIGGRIGEGANLLRSTYTGAGYESGFEARSYMREMRQKFDSDWTEKHGTAPSEADRAQFETNLESTANGLFAYNLAIVGSSNIAMFGSLAGIKLPGGKINKWFNKNVFGSGVKVADGIPSAIKASRFQKVGQYAYSLGKGAIVEGVFEEGMQAVGKRTAENMMREGYDQKFANASYDTAKAFGNAFSKTYGTQEGLEEVYTGMLIGALTGSALGVYQTKSLNHEFKNSNERARKIEEEFGKNSTYSSKVAIENMVMNNRVIASKKAEENAAREGDLLGGQLSRQSTIFHQLTRAQNLDYFDQTVDSNMKEIDLIDEQTLMEEHGLTEDQAVQLKKDMKEEYKTQSEAFSEAMEFSKYFIGNKITKKERDEVEQHLIKTKNYSPEQAKTEAKTITTDMLSQAMAYEMYLGKVSHNFSNEMLQAFQNEVQNTLGSSKIKSAFTIHDVLAKSSYQTKRKADATKKELQQTTAEFKKIEDEYRQVENIMAKATTPEARQSIQGRLSDLLLKKEDLAKKQTQLSEAFNVIVNSAKLENPLGTNNSEEFIPTEDILTLEETINKTMETIKGYQNTNPVQGEKLEKLLREYEKSVVAFKRYSERTSQMTTEGLGLRGKRNILTALIKDNTPSQATVKMIQGLMDTHFEASDAAADELKRVAQQVKAKQDVEEGEIPGVVMEAKQTNPNQEEIDKLKGQVAELEGQKGTSTTQNSRIEEVRSKLGHVGNQALFDNFINLLGVGRDNLTQDQIDILLKGLSDSSVAVIGGTTDTKRNSTERGDLDTAWVDNPSGLKGVELQEFTLALAKLFTWIQSDNNTRQQPETADETGTGGIVTKPTSEPVFIGDIVREVLAGNAQSTTSVDNTTIEKQILALENRIKKLEKQGVDVSAKNYIIEQIRKHPYLFSQIGEDYDQAMPTEEEIDEYYDLVDKDIIEGQPLTPEEVARFNELNIKMANWQLLEAMYGEGVTIAEMIKQDVMNTKEVKEQTEEDVVTDNDVTTIINNGSEETGSPRPMSVLQTIQNVFVQRFPNSGVVYLSHMTPKAFLTFIGKGGSEVQYYKTKKDKDGNEVIDGNIEKISAEKVNEVSTPGTVFMIDNTSFTVTDGARLKMTQTSFDSFGFRTRNVASGYQMVFGIDGKAMKSDFADVDTYSPNEVYKLKKGTSLTLKVDRNDPYNKSLSEEELENNLKISLYDEAGNKVADLKAKREADEVDDAYSTIRLKAAELWKSSNDDTFEVGTIDTNHTYVGSPNIELDEAGKEKQFPVTEGQVVTYGMWNGSSQSLKAKEKLSGVRTDLLKGINKDLPIIVVKEGDTLIAYPVSLVSVDSMKGDKIVGSGLSKSETSIALNEALLKAGKRPTNIYYFSDTNQNMFNEDGSNSEELEAAIKKVNEIQEKINYKTEWFKPEHNKAQLETEATANIDLEFEKFLSPKIVIAMDSFIPSVSEGKMTDEEMTTIISDLQSERRKFAATTVKVIDESTIYISSGNSTFNKYSTGYFSYLKNPQTGDTIFISKSGLKWKEALSKLSSLSGQELQAEMERISKGSSPHFVKSEAEISKFNDSLNKIVDLETQIENSQELKAKFEESGKTFVKKDEATEYKRC